MDDLREMYEQMMSLYEDIKREVKSRDTQLYKRWEAGGFLVDDNVVSMYPSLGEVIESVERELCECGEELDQDCFGQSRCPICDPPCPGCRDQ